MDPLGLELLIDFPKRLMLSETEWGLVCERGDKVTPCMGIPSWARSGGRTCPNAQELAEASGRYGFRRRRPGLQGRGRLPVRILAETSDCFGNGFLAC